MRHPIDPPKVSEAADPLPRILPDFLRCRFEEGRRAVERGDYFAGPPADLLARVRERIEAKLR